MQSRKSLTPIHELYLCVFFLTLIRCEAQQWLYGGSNSLCYSEGKAFRCVPPFTNIIENMVPEKVTSTCGHNKKQRICSDQVNCHSCMKNTHSPLFLTDQHLNNNVTYWASDFVPQGESVNITFSFEKLFEIYYISLVLIPLLEPDSVVLYKSADYGKSWIVWHYFSKDCQRAFSLPTTDIINQFTDSKFSDNNLDETIKCGTILDSKMPNVANSQLVLAFTTNNPNIYTHATDQYNSWMSATNIKISLLRFDSNYFNSHFDGFTYPPLLKQYFSRLWEKNHSSSASVTKRKLKSNKITSPSILRVSDYFALADISVGGRCQCYGHAGRCLKNPADGTFHCDCQHNTAGKNCEICRNGFVDKRWSAATIKSAGECKRESLF